MAHPGTKQHSDAVTLELLSSSGNGTGQKKALPRKTHTRHASARKPEAVKIRRADHPSRKTISRSDPPVRMAGGPPVKPVATGSHREARHLINTHGSDLRHRRELVRRSLEAHKFYPPSARRRGIEGEVEIGFSLNGEGKADQIMVLAGSGYAILDRAAVQTVERAQPFPIQGGEYRFRLRFGHL